MTTGSDKERTAIHEAGHALVAYLLDIPIHEVSIIPKVGTRGHVISGYDNLDLERCVDPNSWSATVMVYLAGELAESILTGRDMRRIDPADWIIAKKLVEAAVHSGPDENVMLKTQFDECDDQFKAMALALYFQDLCGNSEPEAKLYLEVENLGTACLLSEPSHWSVLQDLADELIKRKEKEIDGESAQTFIKGRLEQYAEHPEETHAPNPKNVNRIERALRANHGADGKI